MKPHLYPRIGFLVFLMLGQGLVAPAIASEDSIKQADTLNQQGLQLLDAGEPNQALRILEQAHTLYKRLDYSLGVDGTLINQSLAYKQIGQYYSACNNLTKVLSLNREICTKRTEFNQDELKTSLKQLSNIDPSQKAIALNNLGDILRSLGQLETSEVILKQAQPYSALLDSDDRYANALSLANTYQSLYKQAYNQLSLSSDSESQSDALNKIQEYAQAALEHYQKIGQSQSKDRIRAQLNATQILLHLKKSNLPTPANTNYQAQSLIHSFVKDLINTDFHQFPAREAIMLQLKLSQLLAEIDQHKIANTDNSLILAYQFAKKALRQAQFQDDPHLRSQAYGTLGQLYLQSGQLNDATQFFKEALESAQASQDDNLSYQWSWKIAQIYKQQGHPTQAIAAYDASIKHLDEVRTTLISANADLQFNYQESVEPVYTEYLQLLLSSPTPNLELVLGTHQQLQVAELENYLKCGKLEVAQIDNPVKASRHDATIHIFELNGHIEVIAQAKNGIFRHQPNSAIVQQEVFDLLNFIDSETFDEIPQDSLETLYNQLIAPLKDHLPPSGDLLFVLDSKFQNLPMSILYDGKQYLIQDYSVTTALNTHLQQIKSQNLDQLKVLFAGLSEDSPSFTLPEVPENLEPLLEVKDELEGVTKTATQTVSLLNHEFTTERFQSKLQSDTNTPIIHVATHGQFSSDLQKTMLLAYNEPINANQFRDLISQRNEIGQASIELLILSACQTAKGDRRSTLGLAGMAVQAGSRNILASLWLAESKATAELVTTFYEGLKNGQSKAKALQQAQIKLLDSPEYEHPYFWGNFILIGN